MFVRLRQKNQKKLTTLHRNGGGLQRQHLPIGLGDVHPENHTDPCVLSSYIRLSLPQLDV